MYDSSEFERLKKDYEDLQLRVTRFSAVEQELINMRDRLDHELDMYKRLHVFNTSALREMSGHEFVQLVAESLVDVFEVESAIVVLERSSQDGGLLVYHEGMIFEANGKSTLLAEIREIVKDRPLRRSVILERQDLSAFSCFQDIQEGIYCGVKDPESDFTLYLIGINSIRNSPLYDVRTRSKPAIFDIFAQQVLSLQSNRQKRKRIAQQILRIQASDRELKKLSLIATRTKNGVIITDNHGRIEWVNESFTSASGWSLEEVKGKKPKDFLHGPNTDPEVLEQLSEALWEKRSIEVTLINYDKHGDPFYNLLEITPVFDEGGNHINFIALQKDITEEMNFRQEIIRVNTRFEIITTKSGIGIWEWQPEGRKLSWNDVMYSQYGVRKEETEPDLPAFWLQSIVPDDRDRIRLEIENLRASNNDSAELEYRMQRFDNAQLRTVHCLVVTERDAFGSVVRLIGTSVDVTETRSFENNIMLKNEELKKINAELDNFVYSISHDLRSPLLSIKGILSLIGSSSDISDKTKQFIRLADSSAERLDGTIQEILDYSRNARLELKISEFDLKELVENTFEDLKFSCPENFRFELTMSGDTNMYSDQYRVNTIIKNIVGNAVKYHRDDISDPYVSVSVRHQAGLATIQVNDNGQGIPEKNLEKVFEMFFRGSSKVSGTGLGLYICKEIINKLGGNISITSQVNEGTSVTITIPDSQPIGKT